MPGHVPNTQTGTLIDHQHGTNDVLVRDGELILYGDALSMTDHAHGGNDVLLGGADGFDQLAGDAATMFDDARGGNDVLIGTAPGGDILWGDAQEMHNNSHGGNDLLIGGPSDAFNSQLFGDAGSMFDFSRGGNDTLLGGGGQQTFLYGDAAAMFDDTRGGNDHLIAGNAAVSDLQGDARIMVDQSRGGNDTLVGSSDPNAVSNLYGDAFDMRDHARGGNDTLVSGPGTDHMWGDAAMLNGVAASPTAPTTTIAGGIVTGADTFVFAPGGGHDDIGDFRQTDHDRIDVRAWGFHGLGDMAISASGADVRIDFDAHDSVTLLGFGDPGHLRASDFLFA